MTNTELRRLLLADPYSQHPALQQALAKDADLRQFAQQLQQQQHALEDALQIPVPPMLAEQLMQIPKQQKRRWRWLTPLALAASVALISVLGLNGYHHGYTSNIGSHALAHVYHEHDYLLSHAQAQPLEEVNLKLADFGANLQEWQDEIIYARYCTFQGVRSLHLAVKTASGYATIFVIPKDTDLKASPHFTDQHYQGLTLAMLNANVVVVSDNPADLQQLPAKLQRKLVFSA
ncbi:DUF3379 family protein [Rheinheimera fenheensis]|uniref:DUF3379 family protein n=1 Tax=Rheinheimera fenheensis TaxID=3152295 RepID=UPI003261A258